METTLHIVQLIWLMFNILLMFFVSVNPVVLGARGGLGESVPGV